MKKRFLAICLSAVIALGFVATGYGLGEETQFTADYATPYTLTTNFSGGSMVYTNTQELPWFVGQLSFVLPTPLTNVLTFDIVKVYEETQYKTSDITTNAFGNIETNYYSGLVTNINLSYITNRVVQHTISNTEYNVYAPNYRPSVDGGYVIPLFTYVYGGNIIRLEFDNYTNDVWVTLHGLR